MPTNVAGTTSADRWPALDYSAWRATCEALHLYVQIAGKYRFAHTPWVNHSWHATLYVTPRGLTTGPVPDGRRMIALTFDLHEHRLLVEADTSATAAIELGPTTVAEFFRRVRDAIAAVGGTPNLHGRPNEVPDPVPFERDDRPRPYDADAVQRFHRALLSTAAVFERFRTGWLGKVSPVHLFWGSFDLAVTRFSGRRAPPHPGGVPHLPDTVAVEAYSHEVASAGFWPGGAGVEQATFYAYAYPEPPGYRDWPIRPGDARYDDQLREFLLPYDAVRSAAEPAEALLEFLTSSYEAAAERGTWDRERLECPLGRARVPREVAGPV